MATEDWAGDPQFQARGMIERVALADGSTLAMPAVVPRLSDTPGEIRWPGPALGEHTDEVLAELGLDAAEIDNLRSKGIV